MFRRSKGPRSGEGYFSLPQVGNTPRILPHDEKITNRIFSKGGKNHCVQTGSIALLPGIFSWTNRSSAHNGIAVIKYNRLTRCDGPLGFVKQEANFPAFIRVHCGRLFSLPVSNFRMNPHWRGQMVDCNPVHIIGP